LFLIDHPIELRPLAKRKDSDPTKAASFQLLIAGEEFINAYNELNDPADQKKRWINEMELAKKGAEDYQILDEDYINALEYGMPPTAGWGLGIDRLIAFLTNQPNLKDVIFFPTLRPVK
jgi:lysyl-tRNA synthetase class 2